VASTLLAGCADLSAVRDFARTSADAAAYRQIVDEYAASPHRQKRYQPERFEARLEAIARDRAAQAERLRAAQAVLAAYMSALGDLAADDLPAVDSQMDGLRSSLEKAGIVGAGEGAIGKETAGAAARIAAILTRAALDHWRQKKIADLIAETDASVQAVTAGLAEIIRQDFARSLDIEAEVLRKYFQSVIGAANATGQADSVPPLARVLWLDRQDEIAARRARLEAYAQLLDRIGQGHAALRANVGNLDDKALASRLKGYARDLKVLYKAAVVLGG
jgi:hypothetical protein